jgi:multidrug efflux pump subunit AcrA (membrane-fusion protein)
MPPGRSRLLTYFFVVVLPGCFLGCGGTQAPAPEEEHLAPVKAVAAAEVTFGEWTELLGTTQPLPNHLARVTAAIQGHVLPWSTDEKGVAVLEGELVAANQPIVLLDDRVFRANREKLAATLAELEEQQKQAGFAVELADIEVKRLGEMKQGSGVTGMPAALLARETAKAEIGRKDAASKQQAAAARLAAARKDLAALDVQLELFTIRSPIAGRLGMLQVTPGQDLAPGTTVAEVVDLDEIDVLCYAPRHVAERLEHEQTARLVGSERNVVLTGGAVVAGGAAALGMPAGEVVFVALQAQAETGNFPIKVRFPNQAAGLKSNTITRVQVLTEPEEPRLAIPEAALIEDQDEPMVVVVEDIEKKKNEEGKEERVGKAHRLRAILGVRDRAQHLVEILGLEDPEKHEKVAIEEVLFITEGGHGLHDDDPVKVEEGE